MSRYASIKRRTVDAKAPCEDTLIHNARLDKNIEYLLPKKLQLENYHMTPISNAAKTFDTWKKENEKRYQEINGRKLRSDAFRLESILIILSEEQVDKCNPDEIWEKAHLFKKWFEVKYQTKVRTMDWHRDEGHSDEDENYEHKLETRNNHIHLEFDNVNQAGKMVRRLFSKGDLKIFQDKIAEIYAPLGFIRGKDTAKKHRHDKPKRGVGQEKFRSQKKAENRENTLKQEMLLLRRELQKLEAKASHYKQLEVLKKQLQEELLERKINYEEAINKIKNETQKIIEELRSTVSSQSDVIEKQNKDIDKHKVDMHFQQTKIEKHEDDLKMRKEQMIDYQKMVEEKNTELSSNKYALKENQERIDHLEDLMNITGQEHQKTIQKKDDDIQALKEEVERLKKDVFSETWTRKSPNGKRYKSKNSDVVKHLSDKNKEQAKRIGDLEKQRDDQSQILGQKGIQITSYEDRLSKARKEIESLQKSVQELQDKSPEKIEVIKEVPSELTHENIMQAVIKTKKGKMKVGDVITKQREMIAEKNAVIEELKALAYFDDLAYDNELQEPYLVEKSYKSVVEEYKVKVSDNKNELDEIKFILFGSKEEHEDEAILSEIKKLKEKYGNMKNIIDNTSKYLKLNPETTQRDVPSKDKTLLSKLENSDIESSNTEDQSFKIGK